MQSGVLTFENGYNKENNIVVQNKVRNIILTRKEIRALQNKRNRPKKKNVEEDAEKEQQRKRKFITNIIIIQCYENSPEPKKLITTM